MNKIKQELEKILFDQLNCNYKFISSTNTSELFQIISHGIEYSETSNFNEAVNITSIGEAKSRSVKYIIRFNVEDLFEYIAGTIITIAGSVTMPWVIVLGFLILVKQLYTASQIDIDENTSKVLWGMYLIDSDNCQEYSGNLDFENIFASLNLELNKKGYSSLSIGEVKESLRKLEELYIVEKIGDEWEIIELIQVNKVMEV